MFKFCSCNQFDNYRKEGVSRKKYYRTFQMHSPSSDAIKDLMRLLATKELEALGETIVKEHICWKVFDKSRFMGKKFLVSLNGIRTSTYVSD